MPRRPFPPALAAALAALLALLLAPSRARGQRPAPAAAVLTLDAGVARVRQAGAPGLTAPSAGAALAVARGAGAYRAAGSVAAAGGRGAARLDVDAAWTLGTPRGYPLRADAALEAARVPNTPWAVLALAGLRADRPLGRAAGLWARAQAGVSRQAGGASPSGGAEAGAWRAAGPGRLTLALAAAAARVTARGLVAAGVDAYGPGRVGVGDLAAGYERAGPGGEVTLALGVRSYAPAGLRALPPDDADPTRPGRALRWRPAASAAGAVWLAGGVGLTAAAGYAPNDPVRGLPAAAYATAGVRVRARAHPAPTRVGAMLGAPSGTTLDASLGTAVGASAEPAAALNVGPAPDGDTGRPRPMTVRAPAAARRVRLRGDVTGWRPVELARAPDGAWAVALALASGTHRLQLRVDEGPWAPPGNLPAVDDELTGPAGLLVAP